MPGCSDKMTPSWDRRCRALTVAKSTLFWIWKLLEQILKIFLECYMVVDVRLDLL